MRRRRYRSGWHFACVGWIKYNVESKGGHGGPPLRLTCYAQKEARAVGAPWSQDRQALVDPARGSLAPGSVQHATLLEPAAARGSAVLPDGSRITHHATRAEMGTWRENGAPFA